MGQLVVSSAQLACSFGTIPSAMTVTPENKVIVAGQPAATIMDHVPNKNIMPFGMCITLSNPQVAAATSAALGVLTPQPCMPITTAPWTPGSPTVLIAGNPALNNSCTLMCNWAGVISVSSPGQQTVNIP